MRSAIAALRSLVLPYGATSGARLILDGVNGVIDVIDAGDNVVAQIDTSPQVAVWAPTAVAEDSGPKAGLLSDATSAWVTLIPPDTAGETWQEGQVLALVDSGRPTTEVSSPNGAGLDFAYLDLVGESVAHPGTSAVLHASTSARVTGGAPLSVERSGTDRYPPVEIGLQSSAVDSAASTGGAVTTDTITVPLIAGRKYDVVLDMAYSSTVAGDTAQIAIMDVTGAATLGHGRMTLTRGSDAWPFHLVRRFTAPATANRDFSATMTRAAGTGSVVRLGTGTAGPSRLQVLEVG